MNAPESAPRLGDLIDSISFSKIDVFLFIFINLLLDIPGAGLLICAIRKLMRENFSWFAVVLTCLMFVCGISLIVEGLIFGKNKKDTVSHRIEFWTKGFRYYHRGSMNEVPWLSVAGIREITLYRDAQTSESLNQSPRPKIICTCYKIATTSGKEYEFTGNSQAIQKLGAKLRTYAIEMSLPWETIENEVNS
jgi:hypothetical protein